MSIHDEKRLHDNGERRKARLTKRINRVRSRQEARLNRRDNSRLYRRSHILYALTHHSVQSVAVSGQSIVNCVVGLSIIVR